jgi:hypothetical protein
MSRTFASGRRWTRWVVPAALLLGLAISCVQAIGTGVVLSDGAIAQCEGGCTARGLRLRTEPRTTLAFFHGVIPLTSLESSGGSVAAPAGTTSYVAEQRRGWYTARTQGTATGPAEPIALASAEQALDVRLSPSLASFVLHVRLPVSDPRAAAYLTGRLSLEQMIVVVAPVTADGFGIWTAPVLGRDAQRVNGSTLALDVHGTSALASVVHAPHGDQALSLASTAPAPVALQVTLEDEAFAGTAGFRVAPAAVAGLNDARWNLRPGETVAFRVEPTASGSLPRLRAFFGNAIAGLSALWPLFWILWNVAAVLVTLRLLPRGGRRSLVRAAFVDVTVGALVLAGALFPGQPVLVVLVASGVTYALAGRRWANALGRRPALTIVLLVAIESVALTLGAYQATAGAKPADVLASLAPIVYFLVAAPIALIGLAPRRLILAARLKATTARYVWALGVIVLIVSVTIRHGAPIDPSRLSLFLPYPQPAEAGFEVVDGLLVLLFQAFGVLAFLCGGGLDRDAPQSLPRAGIVALLAMWSVGFDLEAGGVPVAALLSLVTIPLVALRPARECQAIAAACGARSGDVLVKESFLRSDIETGLRSMRRLEESFLGGELALDDYENRVAELARVIRRKHRQLGNGIRDLIRIDIIEAERALAELEEAAGPSGAGSLQSELARRELHELIAARRRELETAGSKALADIPTLFHSMPLGWPIRIARQGAAAGALLAAIAVLAGLDTVFGSLTQFALPGYLSIAVILHALARGAVAAFVFVLFLPYFRGTLATVKGLVFSAAIVAAAAPVLVLFEAPADARASLLVAVLFFPLVGVTIDAATIVRHLESLSLNRVFGFAQLGGFAAIGTVVAGSIASALTGELGRAATTLVASNLHLPTH